MRSSGSTPRGGFKWLHLNQVAGSLALLAVPIMGASCNPLTASQSSGTFQPGVPATATLKSISLSGYSTTVSTGDTVTVTAKAIDTNGNTMSTNSDSLTVTSSDASAILPSPTFSSGVATFKVTLNTSGSQTITVTDAAQTSITATTSAVTTLVTGQYENLVQMGNTGYYSNQTHSAVDSAGNVIIGGNTTGNLVSCNGVSGSCPGGSSTGTYDYFISKYNASGSWLWSTQLGEAGNTTYIRAIAVDSSNNIYVAGTTTGNLLSCLGVSANCTGTSQGTLDYYISKYDPNGNWLWTQQLGEVGYTATIPNSTNLAVDSTGAVYISGNTNGYYPGCNGVGGACTGASSQGSSDYFVSKYDTNGNWKWTQQLGETGQTNSGGIASVAVDSANNVYIGGNTSGYLPGCSGISGGCGGVTAQGSYDYFLSKYDSNGNWKWTEQLGETGKTSEYISVATDSAQNVLIAGVTTANLVSCSGVSSNCTGSSQGNGVGDYFISKYDTNGNWTWTKQLGETGKAASGGYVELATDLFNNIYIDMQTAANLASCSGVSGTCSGGGSTGTWDYYIAKYDSSGNWKWARQMGEASRTVGNIQVANDPNGYVYVTGLTSGYLPSCSGVSANCTGTSQGLQDYFFAKYAH